VTNTTVIVPTYNRSHFIERCLLHFNYDETRFQIVIADGSGTEHGKRNQELVAELGGNLNIHYESYSSKVSFVERCHDAVRQVNTKFAAFHADDDFMYSSGIEAASLLMSDKPDVIAVQGMSAIVRKEDNNFRVMPYLYSPITQKSPIDRLAWHMRAYRPTFYSTHRKETLETALKQAILVRDLWPRFFELVLSALIIVQGKVEYVDNLYAIRESHLEATSQNDMNWASMAIDDNFSAVLTKSANCVAGLICQMDGMQDHAKAVTSSKKAFLEFVKIALVPSTRPFPRELVDQSWSVHDYFDSLSTSSKERNRLLNTFRLMM